MLLKKKDKGEDTEVYNILFKISLSELHKIIQNHWGTGRNKKVSNKDVTLFKIDFPNTFQDILKLLSVR